MYKALHLGSIGHNAGLQEAAPSLARHGVEGVWLDLDREMPFGSVKTRRTLEQYGLKAAGFGAPVRLDIPVAENAPVLRAYAEFAAALGMTRASSGIMPFSDTLPYAENYSLCLDRFGGSADILYEYGIRLGIEFIGVPSLRQGHKYEFLYNMDQMLAFCNDVGDDRAGLLVDLFHFQLAGHTAADLARLRNEQVVLVHIMDAPALPVDQQQDLVRGLPGSTGYLAIGPFLGALEAIGYDGPVLPEPFDAALSAMPLDQAVATVEAAVDKVWLMR